MPALRCRDVGSFHGPSAANGGRALLGNGGGAARHSRVVGLLHAEGLVGVQAVLVVGGDSTKHPEARFDCRLGYPRAVAWLAGSVSVQT